MSMTPLGRAQARRLRALQKRRQREENGLFLAEGLRVVEDLLASPVVIHSAVVSPSLGDNPRGQALLARLRAAGSAFLATEAELRELAQTESPQGVVVVAHTPRHALPASLPDGAFVLVLDAVQDPGNFGTLVRGADAFGARAVIALPGTVDFWNGKAVRAAAGSSFRVPLVACEHEELWRWAVAQGVTLWGAAADGDDVASCARPSCLGLVLGNEGAGLSPGTLALLERRISIPISGAAESLNVAMAGTVLMYLLRRGR